MKKRHCSCRAWLFALGLLVMAPWASAALLVEKTVAPLAGGGFHYDFAITNSSVAEIAIVTFNAPLFDLLIRPSLSSPAGFLTLYDETTGSVDLIGDTMAFSVGSRRVGFGIDAGVGLGSGFFDGFSAIDVDGNFLTGAVTVVPLPPSLLGMAAGILALRTMSRRGRRAAVRAV